MNRREFLSKSASLAGAIGFPYFVSSRALAKPGRSGANDRLKVAFIGTGGRAWQLMATEGLDNHADIVAMADCFLPRCKETTEKVPGSDKWTVYQDYRKLLDQEKIDAVFVPTTTHARALICIHAMQAGLDVYAEKPISLTVQEGQVLIKAVKKYDRIFQAGMQQRSMPMNAYASKLVREGAIGKVHTVIAQNFAGPHVWDPKEAQTMPEGLDWDLWCNQTDLRNYHKDLHRGWQLWRAYDGAGFSYGVTGWGTHALDQVQCALGTDDTGPVEIRPDGPDDKGIMKVTMRYAGGTELKLHGERRGTEDLGAILIGDEGKIEIIRGDAIADPPELLKDAPPKFPAPALGETKWHMDNFFDCVRTRKQPNCDVATAHRSTSLCHLVNMCRELDRPLKWDPKAEQFECDDEANALLSRPRRKGWELPADLLT
jgi:predicted dehydrogenase